MRRTVGVARVQQQHATQRMMADLGAQITAERVGQVAAQLENFEEQLRLLANKYKDDIKHDPVVRARFRQLADSLGLDLISSRKNVFAGVLGLGDFYYALASKVVEACMREERFCGAYVPLKRVIDLVQQSYDNAAILSSGKNINSGSGSNSRNGVGNGNSPSPSRSTRTASAPRTVISKEDILTALSKLRVFGSGYLVVEMNGVTYVQTSSDGTQGGDDAPILRCVLEARERQVREARATATALAASQANPTASDTRRSTERRRVGAAYVLAGGNNSNNNNTVVSSQGGESGGLDAMALFQARSVAMTEAQFCAALQWPAHRVRAALQRMVQNGIAWVDYDARRDKAYEELGDVPQTSEMAESVTYWFVPAGSATSEGM